MAAARSWSVPAMHLPLKFIKPSLLSRQCPSFNKISVLTMWQRSPPAVFLILLVLALIATALYQLKTWEFNPQLQEANISYLLGFWIMAM